jgi:hypothetical protein
LSDEKVPELEDSFVKSARKSVRKESWTFMPPSPSRTRSSKKKNEFLHENVVDR